MRLLVDDGSYNGGDYSAIPGTPGVDYPIYSEIPKTSFDCKQQPLPGYYADIEAQCQVFHICALNTTFNFLCPNGTIFSQEALVCVWWNQFDCNSAPGLFGNNAYIYDYSKTGQSQDGSNGFSGQGSSFDGGFGAAQPSGPGFGAQPGPQQGFGGSLPSGSSPAFGSTLPSSPGFGVGSAGYPAAGTTGSAYPGAVPPAGSAGYPAPGSPSASAVYPAASSPSASAGYPAVSSPSAAAGYPSAASGIPSTGSVHSPGKNRRNTQFSLHHSKFYSNKCFSQFLAQVSDSLMEHPVIIILHILLLITFQAIVLLVHRKQVPNHIQQLHRVKPIINHRPLYRQSQVVPHHLELDQLLLVIQRLVHHRP